MSLLKEMMLGPSGLSAVALASNAGSAAEAQKAADEKLLKKKKKMRRKMMKEARNHMGDREYQTYASWKAAAKKKHPNVTFRGDKDIGAAVVDGQDVGEWDGAVGTLFEDAAGGAAVTGAHNIAGNRGSFFGGADGVDMKELKMRRERLLKKIGYHFISEANGGMEGLTKETDFNPNDVLSKLDAAEKKSEHEKDTVAFGMEDEDGNVVKVYVPFDQADEFEMALSTALAGQDENNDDDNTQTEIAEVLFDLKDKFDIVSVEWGEIPKDEEEEQELADAEGDKADMAADEADAEGDNADMAADEADAGEEDAVSALQSVIDVMKADAEAKKAEANAKKAEAEAEEAKYAAQAAVAKVRSEESILDMEAAEENEKKAENEAKTLAKLARFQHEKAGKAENSLAGVKTEEEEQKIDPDGELSQDELAELIYTHLRGQQ